MFFEDEKDNLENLDSIEDLELDLDDEIDDESISWDELLKDGADELVSVSADAQKVPLEPVKPIKAKVEKPVKAGKKSKIEESKKVEEEPIDDDLDLDLSELTTDEFLDSELEGGDKKDAFDVFGGEKNEDDTSADNIMDDEEQSILKQLDEMDVSPELDGSEQDEISYQPSNAKNGIMSNIPAIAGIVLAALLVIGSLIFIFAGPKNTVETAGIQTQEAAVDNQTDENAQVNLPQDGQNAQNIPVVNDKNAKDLKAEKKIVLSVESAGRTNPFLPTIAEFDKNLYSGIPAQTLLPPDTYGEEPDAQELMKVSVSGILFDNVKPSAIITISGSDYFVQKGDMVDDYRVLDINRQSVVIKKGTNVYKAGVGERFSQNTKIDGSAIYQTGAYSGARKYRMVGESDYTSVSEVQVNVRPE